MRRLFLSFWILVAFTIAAAAQGCGDQNPNCIVPTAPPGTSNNQAASTAFVQSALPSVLVTAAPFNAACNGTGDDSAAINAAINSFPAPGAGVVLFPPNANCRITSSINIGNGTSSSASTRQGVILEGIGNPTSQPSFAGFTTSAGPKITWAGSGSSGIIAVNGPLEGWGVHNLILDCQSVASSVGLSVISAQFGDVRNLTAVNCFRGINSTAVAPFGAFTNTDSLHNDYYNTSIEVPAINGAIGALLTGLPNADTDYGAWTNTTISLAASGTVTGLQLQVTDSVTFVNTHFFGGSASATSLVFDYSVSSGFPSGTHLFSVDPFQSGGGTQFANTGTPGGSSHPNVAFVSEANSVECPNLTNFTCYGANVVLARGANTVNAQYTQDTRGHFGYVGTAPAITGGCNGAGSSVSGNDSTGFVIAQTSAVTTCTITFANSYLFTPSCIAVGNSAPLTGAVIVSTTTLTVNFPSTANFAWSYICTSIN